MDYDLLSIVKTNEAYSKTLHDEVTRTQQLETVDDFDDV